MLDLIDTIMITKIGPAESLSTLDALSINNSADTLDLIDIIMITKIVSQNH